MATTTYRQKPLPSAIRSVIDKLAKEAAAKIFEGQPDQYRRKGAVVSGLKAHLEAAIRSGGGDDLDEAFGR